MQVRDVLQRHIQANKTKTGMSLSAEQMNAILLGPGSNFSTIDPSTQIVELREYDVPYIMRVSIDLGFLHSSFLSLIMHQSQISEPDSGIMFLREMEM